MNTKAFKTLEFDKILAMLAENTVSVPGREKALALEVLTNAQDVRAKLKQTDEAATIIEKRGGSPIHGFSEMRAILSRIKLEAVLSMPELLTCAQFLKSVRDARRGITDGAEFETGEILGLARLLVPFRDIEDEIFNDIISDTEMADNASARLASIRRQIRSQNDSIKDRLNALVRALDKDGVLQEGIITMRSDRYVLPVIAAHKGRVPGIVHDQSASGATLFIEPMAVVEINNAIRQLKLDERDEIARILAELSARLSQNEKTLESDHELMAELDLIFAKARLSRQMDGVSAEINEKGYVDIHNGRHPLIDEHKVVPITVWLGKSFTELLVTGPNTGGKTVTLKTIGLFALMTQSGLHVPAESGTKMPVFDEIFADIGDEQSIEQNLSTFSSHMKNIAAIMQQLTPNSLVLLDELGAGTDPTEGAALAMSILEELRKRRIRTVVTSHYAELKAYSLSHEGTENASVEFDVVSLKPTYKLMVGVPGNSNAFLISAKLGLEQYLIDRARSYVDEDSRKLDKVLTNAEEYRASAQAQREEAEHLRVEIAREKKKLEQEKNALEVQRNKMMEKAEKEAAKIREEAKEQANAIIDEMKQLNHAEDPSAIFKAREMRKKLNEQKKEEKELMTAAEEPITEFLPGMPVYVPSLDKEGTLLSVPNGKGKVTVQLGIMQTELDARLLTTPKNTQKKQETSSVRVQRSGAPVPMTLDVRGQLADEAVANVDIYLDSAFGHNIGSVTILHGKGTGALRAAIWSYLKQNKKVASYRLGAYGEGDAGVTIVELKA